jgi:hypothetical protein
VAQPESKTLNDNPTDDDPDLLNLPRWSPGLLVGRAPYCRCASLTQENWTVRFDIPDGPVFMLPNVSPSFLVLDHEDAEGGLRALA